MPDPADLRALYAAFNARDVERVLTALAPDVQWPNGWEGGWVFGHDGVRDYWRRQWAAIDPAAEPEEIVERDDGLVDVRVHQRVKDLDGNVVAEGDVTHRYEFDGELVSRMTILDD